MPFAPAAPPLSILSLANIIVIAGQEKGHLFLTVGNPVQSLIACSLSGVQHGAQVVVFPTADWRATIVPSCSPRWLLRTLAQLYRDHFLGMQGNKHGVQTILASYVDPSKQLAVILRPPVLCEAKTHHTLRLFGHHFVQSATDIEGKPNF